MSKTTKFKFGFIMITRFYRNFSSSKSRNFKVAIYGGSGRIGQPMALLMKLNPLVTELRLQDVAENVHGVALDVSHIEYPSEVSAYHGENSLKNAIKGVDLIVFTAGPPRKPGMTRDDLLKTNGIIAKKLAEACAEVCPKALIATITNPVNTLIPMMVEIMKKHCIEGAEKRICGVTTLDNVRSNTFVARKLGIQPKEVNIPVIGGHSLETIIPLFSKGTPKLCFSPEEVKELTLQVQKAGDVVLEKKLGTGASNLGITYASARFVNSLLRGLKGEPNIVECTYAKSDACPSLEYFASPMVFGRNGVEKVCKLGELSDFENQLLAKVVPILQREAKKGIEYAHSANSECKTDETKKDACAVSEKKDSCNDNKEGSGKKC